MTSKYDALVVGAGISGCAIASAFARQGRHVLVVERSLRELDRIVGELLQPGGVAALFQLELAHCLRGIEATPAERRVGRSFHHGRFVSNLRAAVSSQPGVTLLEATALELLRDDRTGAVVGAACVRSGGIPEKYYASLTVLADGASSNLRSRYARDRPTARSHFWGLEMLDADLPHPRYAYGILGVGSPVLMYQISARETRILIDIPNEVYCQLGTRKSVRDYIRQRIVPTVPPSVQPSLRQAIKSGRLRSMPNSQMPSTRNKTPGLVIPGDASNMRHPVTGAGMTVALKDAALLAELLSPARVPSLADIQVLREMRRFHWQRKAYSASPNILAQALYLLFVSEDPALIIMQQGFIRYVQEGEQNFAEPAWITGGLVDDPLRLFYHFFKIAIYSIRFQLQQIVWLKLPAALFQSVLLFGSAIAIVWRPITDELQL
ncbi:squalene epoxidase [Parathielavia hyrcaniae]|uniref:Squalene monooxygenase n=1 Tax=Parathielavia hyrcaniae TaxID=113614 RepID=A0AAN6SXA5_9PEZI|nr:squalene epoxidase [Parathielavia hyrcaniae]